jgi:hypothetical protein
MGLVELPVQAHWCLHEADPIDVIGAADNYPNTPLLALDIKANATPEKKGQ